MTLCGSTRFFQEFRDANLRETLAGRIVLSIGCDTKSDQALEITTSDKESLDVLHLHKICMSDEVLILNPGGYIGESTARELALAVLLNLDVRYLEPGLGAAFVESNARKLGGFAPYFQRIGVL